MTRFLPLLLLLAVSLSRCGGHGGPGPAPLDNTAPAETLRWVQPPVFADNTPLNLRTQIHVYEIHLHDNAAWADNTAVAAVGGVDNTGNPLQTFDLRLLERFGIQPGDNGAYLTVRIAGVAKPASGFGTPTFWEAK